MTRQTAKRLIERVLRRRIKRVEPGAVALIDTDVRHGDWFCDDLVIQRFLENLHVDLVLDVGANEGQFAQRLRHAYSGEIMSFEPVSKTFGRLSRAAADDARWSAHQLALGSAEALATIHVASDTTFSSLLPANTFSRERFRRSVVEADEVVQVKRLDAVLAPMMAANPQRRLFLKLDTQGYDLEVFGGLGEYIENVVVLQSEVSLIPIYDGMPHWTETIATYERAGLSVAGMFPVTFDRVGRVIEYDCVLVRAGE